MRRTQKIRVFFTWLALLAIGLTVMAPVVSRTLASVTASVAHHDIDTAAQMPAEHADAHPHDHAPVDHDDMSMEECGYCGLLGHSPLLIVIVWLPGLSPQAAPRQAAPTAPQRGPERSTLVAVPRGPPAFAPG